MDYVLADAIKNIVLLQKRLRNLEEQEASGPAGPPEDEGFSDEKSGRSAVEQMLEIKARVIGKSVLVKIQCEKRKGVLVEILRELAKGNMIVVSANVVALGDLALDITITVEKENDFSTTVEDIVSSLHDAIQAACSEENITSVD